MIDNDKEPARPPGGFHLTIYRLALGLAAALIVALGVMSGVGALLLRGMQDVADGWHIYDLEAATKADALSEVRGFMGFGGVIDLFHEYQVMGRPALRIEAQRAISLARANLNAYREVAPPTPDEVQAIATVEAALAAIEAALPQVELAHAAGQSPHDVLTATTVEVRPAVDGLRILNAQLSQDRAKLSAANIDGIARLQAVMVVGGGFVAVLVLVLAGASVLLTRDRIVRPLGRLVEQSRMLARRSLDQPFYWKRNDELGLLGRTLESSRVALRDLFAAIDEKARRLSESERRYAMAAAAANDGLWDWDLEGGEVYLSPRLCRMLDLDEDTASASGAGFAPLLNRLLPDDAEHLQAVLQGVAAGDVHKPFDLEVRACTPSRPEMWLLVRGIVDIDGLGYPVRAAGSASDITERKSYEGQLVYQATHDDLTGLRNRACLVDWLRTRLEVVPDGQARGSLALLFLDLDGFKLINDSLGHAVGDLLLMAVARRIAEALDEAEFVVRLGGDEFVVVLEGGGEAAALERAHQLEAELARPFVVEDMELRTTVSIGVAIDDGLSHDADSLLRDADIALYRAKEHGKARTEVFNTALREAILIRHRLQTSLLRALVAGEVFLVYQPIIRLDSGRLMGFEALVRWRHPDLGLISPAQFIPIAEETGQILPLGRFVLETAADSLVRWRRMLPADRELSVNVNLSARQLWDERYVDDLLRFLASSRATGIKIEVTESMTMGNPEMALDILQRFRDLGVPLCMDDFGTGYSSLSYLTRFPFNVLKIDRSFITGLDQSADKLRLLRGIVNLAHDIGLEVVGEGIETEAERQGLLDIGCDFGQGFLFSRPIDAQAVDAMLARELETV
jgi:diguanylate cyclase (GGDEF)-like protein